MVLTEAGLLGVAANLLGIAGGLALSAILIYVINFQSFGWTIQMALEPSVFIEALILGILAAVMAGIYPAWRLLRISVAEALRAE